MLYRAAVTGDAAPNSGYSWWRGVGRRVVVRALFGAVLGCGLASCGGTPPKPTAPREEVSLQPPACKFDEVREYRCDALLPRTSALPAPEPYETCPSALEVNDAVFPPPSGTGRFDASRTERARRRAPPGTQCCYSWCGKIAVVDPAKVVDRCREPLAFHESYCVAELESGTRGAPASAPYGACPAAIRPPDATAFSVPSGALLDHRLTAARRSANEALCCYDWCSIAPPGTGLQRSGR